jgi:hypothetical protein
MNAFDYSGPSKITENWHSATGSARTPQRASKTTGTPELTLARYTVSAAKATER